MSADCTSESAFVTQVSLAGGPGGATLALSCRTDVVSKPVEVCRRAMFARSGASSRVANVQFSGPTNQRAFDSTCDQAAKTSTGDAS